MHLHRTLLVTSAATIALALCGCAAESNDAKPSDAGGAQTQAKPDVVRHKLIRVKQVIGFDRDTIKTDALDKGLTELQQAGRPGVRVRVMKVTIKNGVEVDRDLVKTFVKRQPVERVQLVGTHVDPKPKPAPASNCDSNYTGACVPIASDVDCGGGSGDGPEYVDSPVRVVGDDVYELDRDGDGVACDT